LGQLLTLVVILDGGDPNHRMNGFLKLCQNMDLDMVSDTTEVMLCALLSTSIY
jgi:hypothetical protein